MTFALQLTEDERGIEREIRLQLASLEQYVRNVSVLDMSVTRNAFFAEVILNDGGCIAEAEQAMLSLKSALKRRGIELDSQVAAEWTLKRVAYGGICHGTSGSIRAAEYFKAELMSGTARQNVIVEVSQGAFEDLNRRLGINKPSSFEEGNALIRQIVTDQINEWLTRGGQSRWNPVVNNLVQMSYLPLRAEAI